MLLFVISLQNLYFCPKENFPNSTSCVQQDEIICSILKTNCRKYYKYIISA